MGTEAQELPKTYLSRKVEEGRHEALVETACKLLALGRPPFEVALATGLPLEEVQKLAH